jgi:predicted transcriptional regulator
MSKSPTVRDPATIKEEISDLQDYLNDLPKELLSSGAFISYENRMVALKRELMQSTFINDRFAASETRHKPVAETLKLTAQIVISHSSISKLTPKELVEEIKEIYSLLSSLEFGTDAQNDAVIGKGEEEGEIKKPSIPLKEIVKDKYVVCLECGKKMRTLKAHLRKDHNLTPKEYFGRYGLDPKKYPLVCKEYSSHRRRLTKEKGGEIRFRGKLSA